jgi:subtilisin family serine protease
MIQNAMQSQQAFVQSLTALRTAATTENNGFKAHRLWMINALYLQIAAKDLQLLERSDDIKHVFADYKVSLIKPVSGQYVRANPSAGSGSRADAFTYGLSKLQVPELRAAKANITGKGVRVAVIDTGIDGQHPDLKGRVVAFKDFVGGKTEAYDDQGHGTHCAGTIGGKNASGTHIGVAPEVQFIGAKFLDKNGSGTFANAVAAMQWVADPDNNPSTDDAPMIVSNSWGGGSASRSKDPNDDPMCQAAAAWIKLGIVPVFAGGNSGPRAETIGLPGACPWVVTVGATDSADAAASFSSRGPVNWKTGSFTKPDIAAPGVKIMSSIPGGKYAEFSGTSMATPHVAGMMALMYQIQPKMPVDKAFQLMKGAVDTVGADPNVFGAGRINALKTAKAMGQ